jgi:hypothetical protein
VTQDRRNIWEWQKVVDARNFDIALDFSGDFYDDPSLQIDQIRRRRRAIAFTATSGEAMIPRSIEKLRRMGLLGGDGWAGVADRILVKHRRHRDLHDDGRCCSSRRRSTSS